MSLYKVTLSKGFPVYFSTEPIQSQLRSKPHNINDKDYLRYIFQNIIDSDPLLHGRSVLDWCEVDRVAPGESLLHYLVGTEVSEANSCWRHGTHWVIGCLVCDNLVKTLVGTEAAEPVTRGPHLLLADDGSQDYCAGPGLCGWCDGRSDVDTTLVDDRKSFTEANRALDTDSAEYAAPYEAQARLLRDVDSLKVLSTTRGSLWVRNHFISGGRGGDKTDKQARRLAGWVCICTHAYVKHNVHSVCTAPGCECKSFLQVIDVDVPETENQSMSEREWKSQFTGEWTNDVVPGSVWKHYNGEAYTVRILTNLDSQQSNYEPTVVYEGVRNGKFWSRPLMDWHRSFTRI